MSDTFDTITSAPVVPQPDRVAAAEALRVAAHARMEQIAAQIEAAKCDVARHAPTAAVDARRDVLESSAEHFAAVSRVGYLMDAHDAARVAVFQAQAEVGRVHADVVHRPRLKAAVAARLDALARVWKARAALSKAADEYAAASEAIAQALGAAPHLRPDWFSRDCGRLDLPHVPDPFPQPVYRDLAEELALWGTLSQ